MKRPSLKSPCVAHRYAAAHERIAEFSTAHGGGLISIKDMGDHARVEIYRCDASVRVVNAAPAPSESSQADALRKIRGLATWESAKAKGEIYRIATEALGGEAGEPAEGSPWHALECAQFWLQEERDSERPGQTKPDDILRVIGDALAGRPMAPLTGENVKADASAILDALRAVLPYAESRAEDMEDCADAATEDAENFDIDDKPGLASARQSRDEAREAYAKAAAAVEAAKALLASLDGAGG